MPLRTNQPNSCSSSVMTSVSRLGSLLAQAPEVSAGLDALVIQAWSVTHAEKRSSRDADNDKTVRIRDFERDATYPGGCAYHQWAFVLVSRGLPPFLALAAQLRALFHSYSDRALRSLSSSMTLTAAGGRQLSIRRMPSNQGKNGRRADHGSDRGNCKNRGKYVDTGKN